MGVLLSRDLFVLPLSPDAMEVVLIFLCSLLAPAVLASGKYAIGPGSDKMAAMALSGGRSWPTGTLGLGGFQILHV